MRKIILFLSLCAAACNASAITGLLLPALSDSISWNSASLQVTVSGYTSGSFTAYYLYQIQGDTVQMTSSHPHTISVVKERIYGLPPATQVTVWRVLTNGGVSDTTNSVTFTTKPVPHTAYITNISYVSTPSQTLGIFSFNTSVPTQVNVNYGGYTYFSNTVTVNGTGTDTVYMTSPNVPNTLYSGNLIFANPVNNYGIVADTFYIFPDYTVPVWTTPSVSLITFSNVVQDSFNFSVHATLGNNTSASVRAKDLDSNGAVVGTHPSVTIFSDTVIQWTRISAAATNDGEQVTISTPFRRDSVTGYQRTTAWTSSAISMITFSNVTQDSDHYTFSVTKGNTATAAVVVKDLDSNGAVFYTHPTVTITTDSAFTGTRFGFPNMNYGQRVIVTTLAGKDSLTAYQRLLQVPGLNAISIDTINARFSTTDLKVVVKTNGKPTWTNSNARVWIVWLDKNGGVHTSASQYTNGSQNSVTLTFTGLTNLALNTGTLANRATLYIQNLAGLMDSLVQNYDVAPPAPVVPISPGWQLEAASSFALDVYSINAGPSAYPYQLYAIVNQTGSGVIDTLLLLSNLVGYTTLNQRDTIWNRLAFTSYDVKLATVNVNNIWWVTPTTNTQQTTPAFPPTFYIENGAMITDTTIDFTVMGCGNGTMTYVGIDIYSAAHPTVSQLHFELGNQGNAYFSVPASITGLIPCTDYVIRAVAHDAYGGNQIPADPSTFPFTTMCISTTGIIETISDQTLKAFPNPAVDHIDLVTDQVSLGHISITAVDGRELYVTDNTEQKTEISISEFPAGIYFLHCTGKTVKIVKQ
jgi:hypothetical protein